MQTLLLFLAGSSLILHYGNAANGKGAIHFNIRCMGWE